MMKFNSNIICVFLFLVRFVGGSENEGFCKLPPKGTDTSSYIVLPPNENSSYVPQNTTLKFSCDYGLHPTHWNVVCSKTGYWEPGLPKCTDNGPYTRRLRPTDKCFDRFHKDEFVLESGCFLPPQPDNGKYKLLNTGSGVLNTAPLLSKLMYSCDIGYVLTPFSARYVVCDKNARWTPEPPKCVESCKDSESYLQVSSATCQTLKLERFSVTRNLLNGTLQVANLNECGLQTPKFTTLIVNGTDAKPPDFPWNVAVYRELTHICGGTIISERLIVSAAHCFRDLSRKYSVGAGKLYRDWSTSADVDPFQQLRQVSNIIIPDEYKGIETSEFHDIALLILDNKNLFVFNDVIIPACIDWNNDYESEALQENNRGLVAGWGLTSKEEPSRILQQLEVPYVPRTKCYDTSENFARRRFLQPDKICAGYFNGSSVCKGDSGSGLMFRRNATGVWYIRGVVSFTLDETCASYSLFTSVSFHLDWIKEFINVLQDGCELPLQPFNGKYSVLTRRKQENRYVAINTRVKFDCNEGYSVFPPYSSTIYCQGFNKWTSEIPRCLINCPHIDSASLDVVYSTARGEPIIPGTVANLTCKDAYKFPNVDTVVWTLTCLGNGSWDAPLFECEPVCGSSSTSDDTTIHNLPWIVGLYSVDLDDSYQKFNFQCEAHIISKLHVVTDSECIKNIPCNNELYVGPFDLNKGKYGPFYRVEVFLYGKQPHLNDKRLYDWITYQIVLLKVSEFEESTFDFSEDTKPVCLSKKFQFRKTDEKLSYLVDRSSEKSKVKLLDITDYKFVSSLKSKEDKNGFIITKFDDLWYLTSLVKYSTATKQLFLLNTTSEILNIISRDQYKLHNKCLGRADNTSVSLTFKPHIMVMQLSCRPGFSLFPSKNFIVHCDQNGNTVPKRPLCYVQCPRIVSETLIVMYSVQDDQPIVPGTVANYSCKPGYKFPRSEQQNQVTCLENGFWNHPLENCKEECGVVSKQLKELGGDASSSSEFPWNVGIYRVDSSALDTSHKFLCGGTLLSKKLVISAAACFENSQIVRSNYQFFVGAGKIFRSWYASKEEDPYQQLKKVYNVILHGEYEIENGFVYDDIALVQIDPLDPFELNLNVRPVCLPDHYSGDIAVEYNKKIDSYQMESWGVTPQLIPIQNSQKSILFKKDKESCNDSNVAQKLSYYDKICFSFDENGLCLGITGSGVVYEGVKNDWYLYAISVYTNFIGQCGKTYEYEAFAFILHYLDWIKHYL